MGNVPEKKGIKMKIFKIALILLVVLIVVLFVAAFIFIKTFDVARYKPQIVGKLSKALDREVDFKTANLGISLKQGVSLKLSDLFIADDPAFSKDALLAIKEASLGIDVMRYLSTKQINVPSVIVNSPSFTLVRTKDGKLNVHSLTKVSQEPVSTAPGKTSTMAIPALLVNSLKLSNGAFTYIDRAFEPAINLKIKDLDASVDNFSLTKEFPFVLEAAILSTRKNIQAEGKAGLDLKSNAVTISNLKAEAGLDTVSLDKIPDAFPMLKGASLPQSLSGKLSFMLNTLTAGAKGLTNLSVDASLINASARLAGLASPIKDIQAHAKITENEIVMDKTSLAIGGGRIGVQGKIVDYLGSQYFNLETDIKDLAIQELIAQERQPVKAEGLIACKMKINGKGFAPEAMKSNLSGNGEISATKAKLKDINVLRTVLDKISVIPGLAEKLQANLSEKYKQRLNQKDTLLSDIRLPILIVDGRFVITNAVLTADEFIFQGQAQAGFDGAYVLEGLFLIPQELSTSMVAAEDKLKYLVNQAGEIQIPLRVFGKAGVVNFKVDSEYIAKRILVEQGTQQLFKVLDKALRKEEPQKAEQQTEPQPTQE